jgi:fucose permease
MDLLITIFFVTYVIFSFPSSNLVEKRGLRFGVVLGTNIFLMLLFLPDFCAG